MPAETLPAVVLHAPKTHWSALRRLGAEWLPGATFPVVLVTTSRRRAVTALVKRGWAERVDWGHARLTTDGAAALLEHRAVRAAAE